MKVPGSGGGRVQEEVRSRQTGGDGRGREERCEQRARTEPRPVPDRLCSSTRQTRSLAGTRSVTP